MATQPLLTPFKGVNDASGERFTDRLATRGRWPAALQGRFYRNGPALFERDGERCHHWFDGDGMVQQFTLADGRITHRGRLVQTAKLRAEASAGRVLAMREGGSAHGLDPADLSTQGPVVWRDDLRQVPFSAHPNLDPAGHLWNIGTAGARIVAWHIDPQGTLAGVQLGDLPNAGGMVHDMAVTERFLVVPLPPVKLSVNTPTGDGPRRRRLDEACCRSARPIAQATLPYVLPLGFHGNFTSA